jgi:hypothetical protein
MDVLPKKTDTSYEEDLSKLNKKDEEKLCNSFSNSCKVSEESKFNKKILKIQSIIRGYLTRKNIIILKKLKEELLFFNFIQRVYIKKEKKYNKNISIAFSNISGFAEELTLIIYKNSFGGCSKGGCAFDNITLDKYNNIKSAREVKICCLIQPKKCECGSKIPYFQIKCIFCSRQEFKFVKDSRFGIDAKAQHLYNNIINEYILYLIDFNDEKEDINFKCYKINSNNKYFQKYLENQRKNSKSSNTCNLLPFSYDFYLSGPMLLFDFNLTKENNFIINSYNLLNNKKVDIPINIFYKNEIKQFNIPAKTKYLDYNNWEDKLILRNKNLNKNRGITTRL